jgi:hypothetical protein
VKAVVQQGPFPMGVLFGCATTIVIQYFATGSVRERNKLDLDREKELYKQLQLRDERINALHSEIAKLRKK